MSARLPEADYDRVYLPYGKLAHLKAPYNTMSAVCLRMPGCRGEWLGTGSQDEHDRAASLPLCRRCQHFLRTTLTAPETSADVAADAAPVTSAVPAPEHTTGTGSPPLPPVVATAPNAPGAVADPGTSSPPVVGVPGSPLSGKAFRDAVRAATSALHAKQRNQRGKRPGPPVVGVRAVLEPRRDKP